MTLMALSLAIGLLIDDAIVVRENIVRHLEHGEDHFEAARKGTAEIGLAVLATSMSIIAVFVPVAFMKGIIGRFFFQFGLTVAFAVLVSLFVSFTLDPMLSSRWVDPDVERTGRRSLWHRPLDAFNRWFERMADWYKGIIGWSLNHRFIVSGLAVVAFVGGIGIFGTLQTEFQTTIDQGEFLMKFKSAPGASMAETRGRVQEILQVLGRHKEVKYTYAAIGAGDADTVRDGQVFVRLVPKHDRTQSVAQFTHDVRRELLHVPGITLSIQSEVDSFQKPLQVMVRGDDIVTLKKYATEIKNALYTVPGIVDVEAALEQDLPEYRLVVDRERAALAGLGSAAVSNTVGVLIGGQAISTYEDEEGEAVNLRLRLPESLRADVRQIGDLRLSVPTPDGVSLVPLADLVTLTRSTSPAEISRRNLSRQVTVDANLDGLPLGTASNLALEVSQKNVQLAPGYSLQLGGDTEIMVESFGYLAEALLLGVIFVYLILAAQFESFIDPLSIMLSLPLSIVGMAGMLRLTGDTISIMSLIGLIMLMGLVTKNAILLVDFTKVQRRQGIDRRTAVITAGRTRLRPIIMTTAAMVFGMLPLFLGIGEGAEMRAPMARAVVGGLLTSTLLTLIVVPVVYTILDDIVEWVFGRGKKTVRATVAGAVVFAMVTGAAATARGDETTPRLSVLLSQAASQAAAEATASATAPRMLTLDEALAMAAAQNRDIRKAIEYKHWVEGKYLEERASALPKGSLGASITRNFDDSQSKLFEGFGGSGGDGGSGDFDIGELFGGQQEVRSATLSVSQVLFTWGQVGAAIRAAKLGFQYSDAQLRRFRQAVARDVTSSFYDVLVARELSRIAKADLEQKERHLEEAKKRQMAGTATDFDVLAAQVAVDNGRPAVIRAENRIRTALEQLRFLLAEPNPIDVTGTLDGPVSTAPGYDDVVARALANRPELTEALTQLGIYKELVTIARAGNKPRLDFSGSWGRRSLALKTLSSDGTAWSAGIFATVPIFDGWRTKGQVLQAETDRARFALDELKLRDSISVEARVAINAAVEASGIVTALGSTVAQAERLLFLAEKGFELGVKTRLEVRDAELNLSSARVNLAIAQRDYRVALVNLDWVMGTLDGGAPAPAAVKP
jgi:HAE1 family hydrophobic/amphiphilic exporter-1